ncbi:hypothetical protein LEMLEM_LOCUS11773, partial [Lemmus lemmus]
VAPARGEGSDTDVLHVTEHSTGIDYQHFETLKAKASGLLGFFSILSRPLLMGKICRQRTFTYQ